MGSVRFRGIGSYAAGLFVLLGLAGAGHCQPLGEMVAQDKPTADVWWNTWRYDQSPRAMLSPNMFGDYTFNRPVFYVQGGNVAGTAGTAGTTTTIVTPGSVRTLSGQLMQSVPAGPAPFTPIGGTNQLLQGSADLLYQGATAPNTNFTATNLFNGPLPASVVLNNNAVFQNFVLGTFGTPGERIQFNQATSRGTLVGANYFLNLSYSLITDPTTTVVNTGGTAGTAGTTLPFLLLQMPNPAGGGMVGRTKVSQDNSPLPRDRVIYDYDYFNSAALSANGASVNRQNVGFEKTFFDGIASFSMQLPFASTVSEVANGGVINGGTTQLGNLFLNSKVLLLSNSEFSVSTGLGVSLPTANDTRISLGGVRDAIRIYNDTTLLVPYVAILMTPSDRVFCQLWASGSFDAIGNRVGVNTGTSSTKVGHLNDPALLGIDTQVGYWVLHPASTCENAMFRGFAPFLEFHYNTTLSDPDVVNANGFAVADVNNRFDDFSMTVGATTQLWNSVFLSTGLNKSIKGGGNRQSDYNLGVRFTWYFGQTAGAREEAIPTF